MRDGRVKLRDMMGPNSREQCGEDFLPASTLGAPVMIYRVPDMSDDIHLTAGNKQPQLLW